MSTVVEPSLEEVITKKLAYGKLTKGVYKILKKKADEYLKIEETIMRLADKPDELEKYVNITRNRLNELEPDHQSFQRFSDIIFQIEENKQLLLEFKDDKEMTKLLQEENEKLLLNHEQLRDHLLTDLLPVQRYDQSNCIVEIKQAVGGKESALFGEWLMESYSHFAYSMGWGWNPEKLVSDSQGHGVKNSKFNVNGHNAYKYFKHESGVHKYFITYF